MTDEIRFYSMFEEPYGVFSNFSHHPFELDGRSWPTVEHYFQGNKFLDDTHREAVRLADGPMQAFRLGRSRKRPLRADWEEVKIEVMRRALWAKFTQHEHCAWRLLQTGDATLVEATSRDYTWGCGTRGTGLNLLGSLLMETRQKLRTTLQTTPHAALCDMHGAP